MMSLQTALVVFLGLEETSNHSMSLLTWTLTKKLMSFPPQMDLTLMKEMQEMLVEESKDLTSGDATSNPSLTIIIVMEDHPFQLNHLLSESMIGGTLNKKSSPS